jgi:hypothetical protein
MLSRQKAQSLFLFAKTGGKTTRRILTALAIEDVF